MLIETWEAKSNCEVVMNSRREFIKTTATGALILGSQTSLGLAAILDQKEMCIRDRSAAVPEAICL